MRARVLAGLWLAIGLAVWNGVFDLYVSRGAREYGQKQAEAELRIGPPVSMATVMNDAKRDGLFAASAWALGIVAAGIGTIWVLRARGTSHPARSTPHPAPATRHSPPG